MRDLQNLRAVVSVAMVLVILCSMIAPAVSSKSKVGYGIDEATVDFDRHLPGPRTGQLIARTRPPHATPPATAVLPARGAPPV